MQKRMLALLLALCLCLGCLPITTRATVEDGGALTDTLDWAVQDTTLTISGTGPMPDYSDYEDTPWADYPDGLVVPYDIYFGKGARADFKEAYMTAKKNQTIRFSI